MAWLFLILKGNRNIPVSKRPTASSLLHFVVTTARQTICPMPAGVNPNPPVPRENIAGIPRAVGALQSAGTISPREIIITCGLWTLTSCRGKLTAWISKQSSQFSRLRRFLAQEQRPDSYG